jgi:hypothetical protein
MKVRRGWASLAILAVFSSLACMEHVARAEARVSTGARVVLLGSSSMNGSFGRLVASDLRKLGYGVSRKGYGAAGLSRPDVINLQEKLSLLPIDPKTDAALIYLGGNDAQALWLEPQERETKRQSWIKWNERGWAEVYQRRFKNFIDAMCKRGARTVILLPPVDVVSSRMQRRLQRIRNLQERAAAASTCGKFVSTAGDALRLASSGHPLRLPDGVHMTEVGAARVWRRVAPQVLQLIEP